MSHSQPRDVDMFLEGPGGQKVWLISDVCGVAGYWTDRDFDLDDEAANAFPRGRHGVARSATSSSRKPTNYDPANDNSFPGGRRPRRRAATALSAFDLTDPDGIWKLWIGPDNENQTGFLDGFDLQLETRLAGRRRLPRRRPDRARGQHRHRRRRPQRARPAGSAAGSITVATTSGTAQSGADFEPVSQVLTFEPGETTKSISVPVIADGQGEPEQGFSIMLGQAEGDAKAGTPAAVGVTIPGRRAGAARRHAGRRPGPAARRASSGPRTCWPTRRRPAAAAAAARSIRFRPVMPSGVGIVRSEVWINGKKVEDNIGAARHRPDRGDDGGQAHEGPHPPDLARRPQVNIRRTFRRCATRKRR